MKGLGNARRRRSLGAAVLALAFLPAGAIAQSPAQPAMSGGPARAHSRLDERIVALTDVPPFRAARWGVYAVDLESGETLVSIDAGRRFLPDICFAAAPFFRSKGGFGTRRPRSATLIISAEAMQYLSGFTTSGAMT